MKNALTSLRRLWHNARVRILFWATLTGLICGISGIGLPVEDILFNARNAIRVASIARQDRDGLAG